MLSLRKTEKGISYIVGGVFSSWPDGRKDDMLLMDSQKMTLCQDAVIIEGF